jgi:hypothetical protein
VTTEQKPRRYGVYSGAVRDISRPFDGRTKQARYVRSVERSLLAQIGRQPTFPEKLLIERCARLALQSHLLDRKLADGAFRDYDGKVYGGVLNALRLCLKELGVKPPPEKKPSLSEYLRGNGASAGAAR